jgi:hypothetical protein
MMPSNTSGCPIVACKRNLTSSTEGITTDRRNDKPSQRSDGICGAVKVVGDQASFVLAAEFGDISTCSEQPWASSDDDDCGAGHTRILGGVIECDKNFRRQGIHLWVVQGDTGNAGVGRFDNHFGRVVAHAPTPLNIWSAADHGSV